MPAWKNQLVEKLQEPGGVATIPCSPTEVNILRRPGTIKDGYNSMLNNPGEHSAASYFKDTLVPTPYAGCDRFAITSLENGGPQPGTPKTRKIAT